MNTPLMGARIDVVEELLALNVRTFEFEPAVRASDVSHAEAIRRSALDILHEGPIAPTGKKISMDNPWAAAIRAALASEWPDVVATCLACGIVLPKQRPA